jgi:hypothetical protein
VSVPRVLLRQDDPCGGFSDGEHYTTIFSALLVEGNCTTVGLARGCVLFIGDGGSRHARCLLAGRLLEQLQKPLSASSRGQPSLWNTGAGLDKGFRICVLGERLGDHMRAFTDVVGSVLALHLLPLSHIRYLAQFVVHEYI